jgi:hypothetical protein
MLEMWFWVVTSMFQPLTGNKVYKQAIAIIIQKRKETDLHFYLCALA